LKHREPDRRLEYEVRITKSDDLIGHGQVSAPTVIGILVALMNGQAAERGEVEARTIARRRSLKEPPGKAASTD
jgi:hypothetical protein